MRSSVPKRAARGQQSPENLKKRSRIATHNFVGPLLIATLF